MNFIITNEKEKEYAVPENDYIQMYFANILLTYQVTLFTQLNSLLTKKSELLSKLQTYKNYSITQSNQSAQSDANKRAYDKLSSFKVIHYTA